MSFNSAERLMGGKKSRRKGPRMKRTKKSTRKAVAVKVKVKVKVKVPVTSTPDSETKE